MTTFVGDTRVDNLDKFYAIMRDMLLNPGWRADDFERVRDDVVNNLQVGLRGNNDEELGKEELYNLIYAGRPYGHEISGDRGGAPQNDHSRPAGVLQASLHAGQPDSAWRAVTRRIRGPGEEGFRRSAGGRAGCVLARGAREDRAQSATLIDKDTRSVAFRSAFRWM